MHRCRIAKKNSKSKCSAGRRVSRPHTNDGTRGQRHQAACEQEQYSTVALNSWLSMRVVSPPRSAKRCRPNDSDDSSRRVLQRTSNDDGAGIQFVSIPSMIKIVKKLNETNDETVATSIMSKLVRFLYRKDGDSNRRISQEAFFNAGGHLAVVTQMSKHGNNTLLQHEGIRALTNATCDNKKLKIVVAEIGGIQATVEAMNRHSYDMETQRLGLKALNNLIHTMEHAQLFVHKLHGCHSITHAMRTFDFITNVELVEKDCAVLFKLCWLKKLKPAMLDANVVQSLNWAMERFQEHEKIQKYARDALAALS